MRLPLLERYRLSSLWEIRRLVGSSFQSARRLRARAE